VGNSDYRRPGSLLLVREVDAEAKSIAEETSGFLRLGYKNLSILGFCIGISE